MTRDLVVCSLEPWDEVWRRNQYLLDGLLRRDPQLRVLLVEPAADPLYTVTRGGRPHLGAGLRELPGYEGRLHELQPTKWLPRSVGPVTDRLLAREVRQAANRLGMARPVLWVNDPGWAHLTDAGWPSLYDITDDWVEAERAPREHARIVENENLLFARCAAVVVCSPSLQATKSRVREVELIQNAVDEARYRRPHSRPHDLPPAPVAIYVGTLHEDRLDVDLTVRIATQLAQAQASLVLVGPNALSGVNTSRLTEAGVLLLGSRPRDAVPAYLQHAQVLVVPHVLTQFTESLDPIKLYEYAAVGKPIASTPVAGFRQLDGLPGVSIEPAATLPAAVLRLLTDPPAAVGPLPSADWSERVAAMALVLDQVGGWSPTIEAG